MPAANRPFLPPLVIAACAGLLLVQGCAGLQAPPESDTPAEAPPAAQKEPVKKTPAAPAALPQTGPASWYGSQHHGKRTASGSIFDQTKLTAAHRSLPFGTRVKVTNLSNDKSVEVEITDRGPYAGNRIIDLSRAAAQALGMIDSGTATVRLEAAAGN
jgi:rare lipoprotein A